MVTEEENVEKLNILSHANKVCQEPSLSISRTTSSQLKVESGPTPNLAVSGWGHLAAHCGRAAAGRKNGPQEAESAPSGPQVPDMT